MKKLKLPKTLVLDYRKWICGGGISSGISKLKPSERTGLGKGFTCLHNTDGYQCCLGQFAHQAGVKTSEMIDNANPEDITDICVLGLSTVKDEYKSDTSFSEQAIRINDDDTTLIPEKVKKLRSLCSKFKRKLILKNFPKSILKEVN